MDIGTSSTKAVAFSIDGKVLAGSASDYNPVIPAPGYHELDPEILYQAFITSVRGVMQKCDASALIAVCFSCAMHSILAVDKTGNPLMRFITWADLRSRKEAATLKNSPEGQRIAQHTGTPIHPMSPLPKLIWLKQHEPEIFHSAEKFISIKEYLWFRLFNTYVVDHSIASASGMFDLENFNWYTPALDAAGISVTKLSQPVPVTYSDKLKDAAQASACGLPASTLFIIGGSDGAMANLGTGAVSPGDLALTIGTSGAVRMMTDKPAIDPAGRIFRYAVTHNRYICGGAVNNGGILLKWFSENMLGRPPGDPEEFSQFIEKAKQSKAGCDGLILLPYIQGERAPVWDPEARGIFVGMHSAHRQADFMRAILEGITYSLYQVTEILEQSIAPCRKILASGGFTASPLWLQMVADLFNKEVQVTENADASAIGAVFVGMCALGILDKPEDAAQFVSVKKVYSPDPANRPVYLRNYRIFTGLYEKLREDMLLLQQPVE